jgi:putative ATPase
MQELNNVDIRCMIFASKIRPKTLDEFVGQEHLTGPGKPLRVAIEKKGALLVYFVGPAWIR